MTTRTFVALASAYTADEARALPDAQTLPYLGLWHMPTVEQPLVHLFSTCTHQQLQDAGLQPDAGETS